MQIVSETKLASTPNIPVEKEINKNTKKGLSNSQMASPSNLKQKFRPTETDKTPKRASLLYFHDVDLNSL